MTTDEKIKAEIAKGIASRSCGECTACCTGMAVTEINKPVETPCEHLKAGGCGIYETRPQSCQDFHCLWRIGFGRVMERPDRVGYFLDVTRGEVKPQAMIAREARPGAFDSASVRAHVGKLADKHAVILVRGDERKLIGPERLVAQLKAKIGAR